MPAKLSALYYLIQFVFSLWFNNCKNVEIQDQKPQYLIQIEEWKKKKQTMYITPDADGWKKTKNYTKNKNQDVWIQLVLSALYETFVSLTIPKIKKKNHPKIECNCSSFYFTHI